MGTPVRKRESTENEGDITVLVVGKEPRLREMITALIAQGLSVETCEVENALEAVIATVPDLALLVGDATEQYGRPIQERLNGNAAGAVVPLILLYDLSHTSPSQAFKHGFVSYIDKNLNVDAIAKRVRKVVRELPERPGQSGGELGEATLDQLVGLLSRELRSGVLSLTSKEKSGNEFGAKIVLRSGQVVSENGDAFIKHIQQPTTERNSTTYQFHEHPSNRLDSVPPSTPGKYEDFSNLSGRRVLIVSSERKRGENLAKALRACEALTMAICGLDDVELDRVQSLDPQVIVVGGSDFSGPCAKLMDDIITDLRMRWASILIYPSKETQGATDDQSNLGPLTNKIAKLTKPDQDLLERVKKEMFFDTRLEIIGPSRTLRALAESQRKLRVSMKHPRATVKIDLADGMIMGAEADRNPQQSKEHLSGTTALAAFMALGTGKVHVEERDHSELVDLASPIDLSLTMAAAEALPMVPSILPPPLILTPSEPTAGRASLVGEKRFSSQTEASRLE